MIQQLLLQFWYLGLYPLVVIEGPLVTTLAGFLIFSGYFHFFPTFLAVFLWDVTSDIIYYHVGFFAHKSKHVQKYIAKKKFLFNNLALLEDLWGKHPVKTMFFGKQAYLLCGPIVISSGVIRVGLGRFIAYSTPVSAFQALLLISVGYYLGNGYELAGQYMKYPAILIAFFLIILIYFYNRIRIKASQEFQK